MNGWEGTMVGTDHVMEVGTKLLSKAQRKRGGEEDRGSEVELMDGSRRIDKHMSER